MMYTKISNEYKIKRITPEETARLCEVLEHAAKVAFKKVLIIPLVRVQPDGHYYCLTADRNQQIENSRLYSTFLTGFIEAIRGADVGDGLIYDDIKELKGVAVMEDKDESKASKEEAPLGLNAVDVGAGGNENATETIIGKEVTQLVLTTFRSILAQRTQGGLDQYCGDYFLSISTP